MNQDEWLLLGEVIALVVLGISIARHAGRLMKLV